MFEFFKKNKKSQNTLINLSYDELFDESLRLSKELREFKEKYLKLEKDYLDLSTRYLAVSHSYTTLYNKTFEEMMRSVLEIMDMMSEDVEIDSERLN